MRCQAMHISDQRLPQSQRSQLTCLAIPLTAALEDMLDKTCMDPIDP